MTQALVLENAAFADVVKKASLVALSKGEEFMSMGGIVIEVSAEGHVAIKATDKVVFYTEWMSASEIHGAPFTWRLSSRLLGAVSAGLPMKGKDREARLTREDNAGTISIASGRTSSRLPLLSMDSYPLWNAFDPGLLAQVNGFTAALECVTWACLEGGGTPEVLRGVNFDGSYVIGTNRHRAARREFQFPTDAPFTVSADVLLRAVKANGGVDCKVAYSDMGNGRRLLVMPNESTQLQVTGYGESFPSLGALWESAGPYKIIVDKAQLLELCRQVLPLISEDRTQVLKLVVGRGEVAAFSQLADKTAILGNVFEVPEQADHPRMTFWFNPKFLMESLDHAPAAQVTLNYFEQNRTKERPWMITSPGYISMVLPLVQHVAAPTS